MKIKFWDKSEYSEIKTISEKRNINVGYFNDCIIEGESAHYPQPLLRTKNELLLPTIERFMSLDRGTIYEDDMVWECKNERIDKVETRPVFYFVYNCANYFHWLYDTVPYLYSYFNEKKHNSELKLLINVPDGKNDLHKFVYETLELLGITKDDLIFLDKGTKYEHVIVGSSLTHNRMSLEPPHEAVFSLFSSMVGIKDCIDRVYVSRRTWTQPKNENIGTNYTEQRKCVNEDEVVSLFEEHGFSEIFSENFSMKETIGIFRQADIVAGPIGGGMSNVLFCPPSTKVISINSPEFFPTNERLKYAINHTNLTMFDDTSFVNRKEGVITGKNALSISGGMNSNWKVDLIKMKKVLSEFS